MADFSLAQIGEQPAGSPQPQQPVQQPSAIQAGLEFAGATASSLFESFANAQENKQNEEINKAVTRFSQQQMQFADWVDRGELTSQEARMRMRNNLIRASADNPNLAEAFTKSHETIIETAGMGKVAATGTEQEQQLFKVMQEARENGFIQPGMSQEQEQQRTYDWMELQQARLRRELAKEELAHQQAQITLQRGRIGLQTDQIALQTARQERAIQDATMEGSRAFFPTFSSRVQDVVRGVEAGELNPVEADLQLRQMLDSIEGEIRQGGATVSDTMLTNLLTPYERLIETSRGVVSGQFGNEVLEQQRDNAIKQTELMILADEDTRALIATSGLLGQAAGPLLQVHGGERAREALNIYKSNDRTEGTRQNPFASEQGGIRAWADIVDRGLKRVNRGDASPTQQQDQDEITRQINGMFESVGRYAEGEDFSKVKPILNEIASDEYARYITGKGRGAISTENEAQVQSYLQTLFLDDIQPLIAEEWRNASTQLSALRSGPGPQGQTEERPTSELIRPMFTGDGVRFVKTNQAGENSRIDAEVRRLNDRVSPAINMFIRLGAHLEEHTNYQQIYEGNYSQLFGDTGSGSAGDGE